MQQNRIGNFRPKKLNLRHKLIITYMLIIIGVVICLQKVSFSYVASIVRNNSLTYSQMLCRNISNSVDNIYDELDRLSQTILVEDNLINSLRLLQPEDVTEYNKAHDSIQKFMHSLLSVRKDIDRIMITTGDTGFAAGPNSYVQFGQSLQNEPWYQAFMESSDLFLTRPPYRTNYVNYSVFSVVRKVRTMGNPQVVGIIQIDLRLSVLDEICKKDLLSGNDILLFDSDKKPVYSTGITLTDGETAQIAGGMTGSGGTITIGENGSRKILSYVYSSYTHNYTAFVVPEAILFKDLNTIKLFFNWLAVFVCIAALLPSVFSSYAMTRAVDEVLQGMSKIEQGNLNTIVRVSSSDEISTIANGLNHMLEKIKVLMKQNTEMEVRNKEAEMMVLQRQINPHFLYNTLDGIRMKAVINEDEETAYMIEQLSLMMRHTTNTGQDLVPLEDELEHLSRYITLQNIRFRYKFEMTVDVPQEIRSMIVPKLILQPVIENAVRHGLEAKKNDRRIYIGVETEENQIVMRITDNGIGMSAERLEYLRESLRNPAPAQHIGLHNIDSRLKLYFGEKYGVEVDSVEGKGTEIRLVLPRYESLENG